MKFCILTYNINQRINKHLKEELKELNFILIEKFIFKANTFNIS
jgi:hypothetical protein